MLNRTDLPAVFASPYMFARKVDHGQDPVVLRRWDVWMASKLAGEDFSRSQSPIGHTPSDPGLVYRFRAPRVAGDPEDAEDDERRPRRRRIAKIDFGDGSHCGCGEACGALPGGCCSARLCGPAAAPPPPPSSSAAVVEKATMRPCPLPQAGGVSQPNGAPLTVTWIQRAPFPVVLAVLDYAGHEHNMGVTLRAREHVAAFASAEGIVWRARALNGELLLEVTPTADLTADGRPLSRAPAGGANASLGGTTEVELAECRFRWTGAAALVARASVRS